MIWIVDSLRRLSIYKIYQREDIVCGGRDCDGHRLLAGGALTNWPRDRRNHKMVLVASDMRLEL